MTRLTRMHHAESHTGRPAHEGRAPYVVLGLLCLAQFLVVLDTSIVNVALPAISEDLGFAAQSGLQYVISLYALTFGGLLIVAGRAADIVGPRRLFVLGLLVFTLASVACGLAPAPGALLTARALQGVGSALVSSSALALLTGLFPEGAGRITALGAWGAVGGVAGAAGLLLGGLLTDLGGWPWIFFLNVPLGLVAIAATPRLLTGVAARQHSGRRVDLPGAIALTSGLGLLIYGLTRGAQEGFWAGEAYGSLVGAVVLLLVFGVLERWVHHPLLAPRLFRVPGLSTANLAALVLTAIVASNLFFTTMYMQHVLGATPLQTGLAFVPNSVLVLVGSASATRLAARIGTGSILAAGFLTLLVGGWLLSGVSADGNYATDVLPGFALTGFGLGLGFVAATLGATHGVEPDDQGLASGVVNSAQQVGFAVGIAALVAVTLALAPGPEGTPEHLVRTYSRGYLLDAGLAALGIGAAYALTRAHRRPREHRASRVRPTILHRDTGDETTTGS